LILLVGYIPCIDHLCIGALVLLAAHIRVHQVRLLSGDTVIVLAKLLYDCDPLTSIHVSGFVDTVQGSIPGTFVQPPKEIELSVDEMVRMTL